jgi:hypothetical protein
MLRSNLLELLLRARESARPNVVQPVQTKRSIAASTSGQRDYSRTVIAPVLREKCTPDSIPADPIRSFTKGMGWFDDDFFPATLGGGDMVQKMLEPVRVRDNLYEFKVHASSAQRFACSNAPV